MTPKWTLLFFALSTFWTLNGKLRADLMWEHENLSFTPAVSDTEVIAHFTFKNAGASAIAVKSVTTACSCTTAFASKGSYAPGETGEVDAKFFIGDRVGPQKNEITLETDDKDHSQTLLTMEVTVPRIAQIEPELLRWLPGDPPTPKRIRVIPVDGVTLNLTNVQPSNPDAVSAQIEPGTRPGEFEIVVTPRGDSRAFSGSLRIETDFPKAHPKALLAHVQIAR